MKALRRVWQAGCLGLFVSLVARSVAPGAASDGRPAEWKELESGLALGTFTAARSSLGDDATVRILRIDPARFDLVLLNASASADRASRTPRQWARDHGLVAVTNASMYQSDFRTSVSLMRSRAHTNNPRLSKDNAVLAFDPLEEGLPAVQIIDRTCQDFAALAPRYGTVVQSIRMISCRRRNVWQPREDKWSTAAIGTDGAGRVLFIHARPPYSTHDLINLLLALPIDLRHAMYVEGGPQAQLYVESGGAVLELVGSPGIGFPLDDGLARPMPLPNVVGVKRKRQ
jgi:hypothetical protein